MMKPKRGAIKAFREFLNSLEGQAHRHFRYRQMSRKYGDYLYHQDRAKFDYEFQMAMQGLSAGFDHTKWLEK